MRPELKADTKFNWRYRTEPYVTIRRPLHPEVRRPVSLAGVSVRDAPVTTTTTALALAMKAGYALIKTSPLLAAIFPHPITYGMVAINGIEALVYANGTADKLEAFAMLGGGLQGAAAQTISYAYQGNNRLQISTNGIPAANVDCNENRAFRSNASDPVVSPPQYLTCSLINEAAVGAIGDVLNVVPVLPFNGTQMLSECPKAKAVCAPAITYTKVGNDTLLIKENGIAATNVSCQSTKSFRTTTPILIATTGGQGSEYLYCNIANSTTGRSNLDRLPNVPAVNLGAVITGECNKAVLTCITPPTMPAPIKPTPSATSSTRADYSSVKPSSVTFGTVSPTVLAAIPPDFTASKIGLAIGLTGAGIVLATMGGGALTYFLYLENKKNRTVRVQEITANKVAITMDRLKVPDEIRVKFEEVAIAQLPLV